MCVVVGVAGIRDGRRCSGQHTDVHIGVAPDGCAVRDDRFPSQVRVSRHDLTQAYQVVAMDSRAIEAVEVWAARFGDEVGSMLGTAAWQCHWRDQDCKAPAGVGVGWEPQHRQAVAERGVVVHCLVDRSMILVWLRLVVTQDYHSTSC